MIAVSGVGFAGAANGWPGGRDRIRSPPQPHPGGGEPRIREQRLDRRFTRHRGLGGDDRDPDPRLPFLYRRASRARSRAEQLARENGALASTDALHQARQSPGADRRSRRGALRRTIRARELVVALFDLDGFKQYNDTFGHPAGDVAARPARRAPAAARSPVPARRTGWAATSSAFSRRLRPSDADSLVEAAADALTETGEGFQIDCSFGLALLPARRPPPRRRCSWRIGACTRTRPVAPRPAARAPTSCSR